MASLGAAVGHLHLLSVAVISSDVEDVALLLAALVDLLDSLVASANGGDSCIVLGLVSFYQFFRDPYVSTYDTSVADVAWVLANEQSTTDRFTYHVRGSEVLVRLSAAVNDVYE